LSPLLLALVVAAQPAPTAAALAEGLRVDDRLEVLVIDEPCSSVRCLANRAERERVRFLFFARAAEDDERAFEVRVYDAERQASLRRRATADHLGEVARALARAAIPGDSARARVIVLDLDAAPEGPRLGFLVSGGFFVAAGAAATIGAVCGVNALVLDHDVKQAGLTQRDALALFDERDGAALCANLGWITAGLTGLLGAAILAQQMGWSE